MTKKTAISLLMNNDRNAFWYECESKKDLLLCLYYSIQESKKELEYNEFLKNIYLSLGGNEL